MNPDFTRLEDKVDTLTAAVTKLVLFEERQSVQAIAINGINARADAIEKKAEATSDKLDSWINRGVGLWFAVSTIGAVLGAFMKFHA